MAEANTIKSSDAAHPAMDMKAHQAMWDGFMKLTVWSTVATVILLILLALFLL